jgi:thiol-disulfide isomerase/thioredoxin
MFYAPCKTILLSVCLFSWILTRLGCGHCKKAKPEFETAAETLSGHEGQALAAIDCTEYSGERLQRLSY